MKTLWKLLASISFDNNYLCSKRHQYCCIRKSKFIGNSLLDAEVTRKTSWLQSQVIWIHFTLNYNTVTVNCFVNIEVHTWTKLQYESINLNLHVFNFINQNNHYWEQMKWKCQIEKIIWWIRVILNKRIK